MAATCIREPATCTKQAGSHHLTRRGVAQLPLQPLDLVVQGVALAAQHPQLRHVALRKGPRVKWQIVVLLRPCCPESRATRACCPEARATYQDVTPCCGHAAGAAPPVAYTSNHNAPAVGSGAEQITRAQRCSAYLAARQDIQLGIQLGDHQQRSPAQRLFGAQHVSPASSKSRWRAGVRQGRSSSAGQGSVAGQGAPRKPRRKNVAG